MERSPHILFVSAFETTFIRADLEFFRSRYVVTPGIGSGVQHLFGLLLDTAGVDVVFSWFASVYGSLAVLWGSALGKRTILQLGGVDLAKDPDRGYGTWTSWWRSVIVRQAIRSADHVLVVDDSLRDEAIRRAGYDGSNIEVLATRFSSHDWFPEGKKEPRVLTVAMVPDAARIHIKGIDTLLDAARRSPRTRFDLVGIQERVLPQLDVPGNVTIHGRLPSADVLGMMQRARVYCQSSRREGLSNSLCEAMLCGCIPVATDVGGSRRAIGETGYVVPPADGGALADAITRALAQEDADGLEARERIKEVFPESRRYERLTELVERASGDRDSARGAMTGSGS